MKAGELVKTYRNKRGITQKDLETVTGISQATISDIEHGADPRWETLKPLAVALNITTEDLMGTEVKE